MQSTAALKTEIEKLSRAQIANKRGLQTLIETLIASIFVFGLPTLISAINSAHNWAEFLGSWPEWTWAMFSAAMVAVFSAIIAWFRRRYLDSEGLSEAQVEHPDDVPQRAQLEEDLPDGNV